jgi:hypothetical protein
LLNKAFIGKNNKNTKTSMQPKQNLFKALLTVASAALALTLIAPATAADKKVDGTWSWSVPGRNGGDARKSTLKLKTEGDKLTGKISSPGRQGAQARETDIEEGKVKGDEISFKVVREFNNNKITQKYNGKIEGDTIKGKVEFDRNGEAQSRDWEAKREADKKD